MPNYNVRARVAAIRPLGVVELPGGLDLIHAYAVKFKGGELHRLRWVECALRSVQNPCQKADRPHQRCRARAVGASLFYRDDCHVAQTIFASKGIGEGNNPLATSIRAGSANRTKSD